jgi:uncharacterized protein (TIGR01777 family)
MTHHKRPILVTGGTGFIGRELLPKLVNGGYQPWVLSRQQHPGVPSGVRVVNQLDALDEELPSLIINLAGEGIADKRWSARRRRQLYESRIDLTQQLVRLYRKHQQNPTTVISGSAIGYYGPHGDNPLAEHSHCHPSFSQQLCHDWENAALAFEQLGSRVCRLRIGVVVGPNGGILGRLKLPFTLGLGGKIGDGKQWMSWIQRSDLIALIEFCLKQKRLSGAINATAPEPVTNAEFTRQLAQALHRPAVFPMPAAVARLLFGQMGDELLLSGQRVIPEVALHNGFHFQFPDLASALQSSLSAPSAE